MLSQDVVKAQNICTNVLLFCYLNVRANQENVLLGHSLVGRFWKHVFIGRIFRPPINITLRFYLFYNTMTFYFTLKFTLRETFETDFCKKVLKSYLILSQTSCSSVVVFFVISGCGLTKIFFCYLFVGWELSNNLGSTIVRICQFYINLAPWLLNV